MDALRSRWQPDRSMQIPWKRCTVESFASTFAPEESFTTVELKVNFFRRIWEAQLRAEGTVVQRGRTISYVECDITDEENRSVAKAASVCCFAARSLQEGRCGRRNICRGL